MRRQLHINLNVNDIGKHPAAWRVADDPRAFYDVQHYQQVAQIAERGTFDGIFLADGPALHEVPPKRPWLSLDPIVVLGAVAAVTDHIGLIATASTTFDEPYNLARRYASLDHASGGRVAWNIVTSFLPAAAANFSMKDGLPDHAARYERAEEFVEVVLALWDSFEVDSLPAVQATGEFADPRRVHATNHDGAHFAVRGPLQVPRTPQGRPVLVQAGASDQGRALAAKYADIVFTLQPDFEQARRDYDARRTQVRRQGRDPEQVLITPGFFPIIGGTEREALERRAELDALLDFETEVAFVSTLLEVPLTTADLDRPLPERAQGDRSSRTSVGVAEAMWRFARNEQLTLRELIVRTVGPRQLVGTPEQVADNIEHWFVNRAADGFNLNCARLPEDLELFVDSVVPLLRRRGIFRHEYTGTTLREHLGLTVPENRHSTGADFAIASEAELAPTAGRPS